MEGYADVLVCEDEEADIEPNLSDEPVDALYKQGKGKGKGKGRQMWSGKGAGGKGEGKGDGSEGARYRRRSE